MESEAPSPEQLKLEQISRDIAQWRQLRPKLRPMPERLWSEAASLARTLGVYPVAQALGLNYGVLKRHAFPKGKRGRPRKMPSFAEPRPSGDGFVEITGFPSVNAPSEKGAVVEVMAADGARLTLRFSGAPQMDVAGLVNIFRERH